jgi:hypothetical protein
MLGLVYVGLVARDLHEKGLAIAAEYALGLSRGAPSFLQLKIARFSLLGTIADWHWGSHEWNLVSKWIAAAHIAGFRVFIDLIGDERDSSTVMEMTLSAASSGADIIALDEPLARYKMSETSLQSVIEAGLSRNPALQFIINEYEINDIRNAYSWTANYTSVSIATDSYNNKTIIDVGIQLSLKYGKKPLAWLIFAKGSQDFDCYTNLDNWIAYVKERHVEVLFWLIDLRGTWKTQWNKVFCY